MLLALETTLSFTDCCGANKKIQHQQYRNRTKQEYQGINKVFVNSLERGNYMQWIYRCEE
ncbi:hypothetical protein ACE6H2_019680 [Prunus campanulata]